MKSALALLLALNSLSFHAFAQEKPVAPPVSTILKKAGAGSMVVSAATTVSVDRISTVMSARTAVIKGAQANSLDIAVGAEMEFHERYIQEYRYQLTHPDKGTESYLQTLDTNRRMRLKEIADLKGLSEFKNSPGFEAALKKYTDLSDELFEVQKESVTQSVSNPDGRWNRTLSRLDSKESLLKLKLEGALKNLHANYIDPAADTARSIHLAQTAADSKKASRFKTATRLGAGGAVLVGFGLLAGKFESDAPITPINSQQDFALVSALEDLTTEPINSGNEDSLGPAAASKR